MFNILTDEPPVTVTVGGVDHPVNCSAAAAIEAHLIGEGNRVKRADARFESGDDSTPDSARVFAEGENFRAAGESESDRAAALARQLEIFYLGDIPEPIDEAVTAMTEFLAGGESFRETGGTEKGKDRAGAGGGRAYSFKYDANLIFAAFYQQYGVENPGALHWHAFKALFDGLTDITAFVKAVQYRTIEINGNMGKEERRFYAKMKRAFALPDERSKEELDREFYNADW